MKNIVEIVTVFGSVSEDDDGCPREPHVFFKTRAAALEHSKSHTWSSQGRAEQREAFALDDGRVFLVGAEINLHENREAKEKNDALAKLTSRERKLLGI
jgi:hypothetical protein